MPNDFWCDVSEVVHKVRISSSDLVARREAAGGAGPVVEAPRADAPVVAPVGGAAVLADCVAGAAVVFVGAEAFCPNAENAAGADAGADDCVDVEGAGCPSLNRPEVAVLPAAGAADASSFFAPPNNEVG